MSTFTTTRGSVTISSTITLSTFSSEFSIYEISYSLNRLTDEPLNDRYNDFYIYHDSYKYTISFNWYYNYHIIGFNQYDNFNINYYSDSVDILK